MEGFAKRYALVPVSEYEAFKRWKSDPPQPRLPYNPVEDPALRRVQKERREMQDDARGEGFGGVLEHAQKMERYLDSLRQYKNRHRTDRSRLPRPTPPAPPALKKKEDKRPRTRGRFLTDRRKRRDKWATFED